MNQSTPSKPRPAYLGSTAIGLTAVGLWSCLALLTTLTAGIPPFQLLYLSFAVAFIASVLILALRNVGGFSDWRQPWPVWALGFIGIFSYHALYFFALKFAPAAEASLIAYLWPLFIVLLSALGGHHRRIFKQLLGALLGLLGTLFILLQKETSVAHGSPIMGYLAALAGALVWASYSVLNRRFQQIPSSVIGGICGLVALAGWMCHLLFESPVQPNKQQWLAIIALGLGPVGLAFFAWDHATKYGHLGMLGALSYLAPLISTFLLFFAGKVEVQPIILLSALLIISGAIIATSSCTLEKDK
ncbi:DMT family transporter [Pseudomonas protegens]|uniref:DMT family transporter n=1 Tax=Pseudomonas protegens TaxID=380021 RepID=UPI0027703D27|nr:DMT family transporter [Pseudomonas protegens]MDP9530528.1 DMT family transporter [Pseudomonas protegens]